MLRQFIRMEPIPWISRAFISPSIFQWSFILWSTELMYFSLFTSHFHLRFVHRKKHFSSLSRRKNCWEYRSYSSFYLQGHKRGWITGPSVCYSFFYNSRYHMKSITNRSASTNKVGFFSERETERGINSHFLIYLVIFVFVIIDRSWWQRNLLSFNQRWQDESKCAAMFRSMCIYLKLHIMKNDNDQMTKKKTRALRSMDGDNRWERI